MNQAFTPVAELLDVPNYIRMTGWCDPRKTTDGVDIQARLTDGSTLPGRLRVLSADTVRLTLGERKEGQACPPVMVDGERAPV
jgi:hypothetical protein